MRKFLILPLAAVTLSGCGDSLENVAVFSKPELRSKTPAVENAGQAVVFPIERTLTDVKGRSINVRILGKKGSEIAITKLPANKRFTLTINTLSEADQAFARSLEDGGLWQQQADPGVRRKLLANRNAVWHSQIENAEKEAHSLGIPLLIAIFVEGDRRSLDLERNLVYSSTFKSWANQSVALCLLKASQNSMGGSREESYQTWRTVGKYGLAQSDQATLALVDMNNSTSRKIGSANISSPELLLETLSLAVSSKSQWSSIKIADAPVRAASPFKVHGGAKFISTTNCGST